MGIGEPFGTLLVANRGEIALRVFRAAAVLGVGTVGVHAADDADSLHVARCDEAVPLPQNGAAAYLDVAAIIEAARKTGAQAIHPGYGFLSENPALARACADADIAFVGPDPSALELFGDKAKARALATELEIPTLPGTAVATLAGMERFLDTLEPDLSRGRSAAVIKAVAGGGGRGMRVVRGRDELAGAFRACEAEAFAAFGSGELYIERLLTDARHIEVQVIGDGQEVAHLWDRDCSVQRRHQKLIEVAPAQGLDRRLRQDVLQAATRLVGAAAYQGVATVEFLVSGQEFFFMEVNPRLQVEHTVTEEVLGLDLVRSQLEIVAGASLADLGLDQDRVPCPRGSAIQIRINAETMTADGQVLPQSGVLDRFAMPAGRGIRVDTAGYPGYRTNPGFDSLLAKIVVHDAAGFTAARRLAVQALDELQITGVATNLPLQQAILRTDEFAAGRCATSYVDSHRAELLEAAPNTAPDAPLGATVAPMSGSVVAVEVSLGDAVARGQVVMVLEAMKMQHVIRADSGGEVTQIRFREGDLVDAGEPVVIVSGNDEPGLADLADERIDPDHIRPDLARVLERKSLWADENRPEAVQKRHSRGMRTARENVTDLVDEGTFTEYGGFAIAAQRKRRELDDLLRNTPADGMITGVGQVNGAQFEPERSTCAVLAYDYTVLAGTQGYFNHRKTDRILEVARQRQYPVVLFAEGGGGRPGDVDIPKGGGLITPSFLALGELSGRVPTVGIAAGRCYAGNAALLGTCDVVIATRDANIGMGGPAMIEGGGLGVFAPEEIGPIDVQTANGVVDVAVEDEAEAVAVAKRYLSYFQGDVADYSKPDQRGLRHVVPENRKRAYDVHTAIDVLCDEGSVLELRPEFGRCTITALVRIAGRPMGLIANNPMVLGGAIDADGADKLARMLQLCEVFGLPVVSLCDTPGFMVGPESEKTATVRHFGRMFVHGARLTVPMATVVLRKSYGLGAMAMAGGTMVKPALTVAWPSGEVGGMGLEGAVRLGFRRELEAIADPEQRRRRYDELVAQMYETGSAINTAMHLEIDDVIDPADTRDLLLRALPPVARTGWTNPRARAVIDAW
ncbi:carboxyl transferase domain-containing protein [Saccharopolyspora shandongensis]|uniref:acetyl-CoA carboxylase family protein n=1 Tax=Saccharopolyspora shandongensis TaxID=418495 RepID=UPI00343420A4